METTITKWIDKNYKRDRLHRDPGTRARLIASAVLDMHKYGSTIISRHESITGKAETLTLAIVLSNEANPDAPAPPDLQMVMDATGESDY